MADAERPQRRSVEDFHLGAPVYSSDGRHIGALSAMLADEESLDLHAIVVKETNRFSGQHWEAAALMEDDIAIPIHAVVQAGRERITLSITSAEARRTPPYLTYRCAPIQRGGMGGMLFAQIGETAYAPRLVEEAHKRLDELEIRGGENVMLGHTGHKLGTVRDLVMDEGELAGIVVHPTGFFKEDVLLQVRFLGRSDDMALFAHLSEDDLAHLQPFHPPAAAG